MAMRKKAAVKRPAAKKAAPKAKAAKTAARKTVAKQASEKPVIKKGTKLACRVCGFAITVDRICGCAEEAHFICCDTPMAVKRTAAKKK